MFAASTFAVMLLASAAADADVGAIDRWHGGDYENCDGSTVEIVECVIGLRDTWDARLNDAYGKVAATLTPERKTALRDVQRKWIAYRDANCSYYASGEGSISRIESVVCALVLTRDRAQELEMSLQP